MIFILLLIIVTKVIDNPATNKNTSAHVKLSLLFFLSPVIIPARYCWQYLPVHHFY